MSNQNQLHKKSHHYRMLKSRISSITLFFLLLATASASTFAEQAIELETLGPLLAKQQHVDARFQETHYSALLTEALRSSGTLGFTPPSRIEKHVTAPTDELFIADAGKIFIVNKTKNYTKTLAVDDFPALAIFVESFRAILGGQLTNLPRFFNIGLTGTRNAWRLQARPKDTKMTEWVDAIEFSGHSGNITKIDIREANGDRSEMLIDETKP